MDSKAETRVQRSMRLIMPAFPYNTLCLLAHMQFSKNAGHTPMPQVSSKSWWSRSGSNRRHPACKAGALPAELRPQYVGDMMLRREPRFVFPRSYRERSAVVGLDRFELSTP